MRKDNKARRKWNLWEGWLVKELTRRPQGCGVSLCHGRSKQAPTCRSKLQCFASRLTGTRMEGNTLSLCRGIVFVTLLTCALRHQCGVVCDCLLAALPRLSAAGLAAPGQVPNGSSCRLQKRELSQWVRVTPESGCPLLGTGFSPGLNVYVALSLTKHVSVPSWLLRCGDERVT